MRKITLLLLFCIFNLNAMWAQNWQTVRTNDTTHFVINDTLEATTGSLRVIWIDSSKVNGLYSTHYFYPSLRPKHYDLSMCLDTAGATWMGKKFVRVQGGDEYYFNLNNDTLLLKTGAALNETWTMFKNSGDTFFQAQVIEVGTTLVDGIIDSFKRISIQAFFNNIPIMDLHNNQIVLSKQHGILRSLEWCYFGLMNYALPYLKKEQGHNRLPAEITNRNLNVDVSKFAIGNEWIAEYRDDVYDINGTFFQMNKLKHTIHDSVVNTSPIVNGINVELFRRERKFITSDFPLLVVTDDTFSSWITMNMDTIMSNEKYTLKDILPEYNRFVMPSLIQFNNEVNYHNMADFSISYGCGGKLILSSTWTSEPFSISSLVDTCFVIHLPLGNDIPIQLGKSWVEEEGVFYSKQANVAYYQSFYETYYANINGCNNGTKYNILLPSDEFKLESANALKSLVQLIWKSINENNVSRFEVQRKLPTTDFVTVGIVLSKGDNPFTNQYTYQDEITSEMQSKELQYRIKMIDHDGSVMYSNVIHLKTETSNEPYIYPIPFNDKLNINGVTEDERYQVELLDMAGRVVFRLNTKSDLNGSTQISGLDGIARGMYMLKVKDRESIEWYKQVVK